MLPLQTGKSSAFFLWPKFYSKARDKQARRTADNFIVILTSVCVP